MKVVTEKVIMPFLPDLEAMKLAKIKECCEKAVVVGKAAPKPKPVPAEVKEAPKPSAEPPKRPGAVIKKPTSSTSSAGPAPKKAAGKAPAKKTPGGAKATEEKVERELTPEEAEEKAGAILPAEVMTGMVDSNWKNRLSSMETMMQVVFFSYMRASSLY